MPTCEDLKIELLEISKIVEKFPEQVKPQVYDLLVTDFLGKKQQLTPPTRTQKRTKKETAKEPVKTPRVRKAVAKEPYSIDRDLNLIGDKSIPSFKEFQKEKKPKSTNNFNAVAVYYLKKIAGSLSLAKVGEKIVNNEWDSWWPKEADQMGMKLDLEKVVSLDFNKDSNDKYDHTYSLPVLSEPHQDRLWVKSLKRLVNID